MQSGMVCNHQLKAPFPWFGGKSVVADLIWQRLGNVPNYVEPFAGSLAVLLARPHEPGIETVNDKDAMIANFWRAVQADPDGVAYYADWPVNENDLHARHIWLVNQKSDLVSRLEGDPEYYDVKVAGWWVWGISIWIGGGWCSGKGPWQVIDGRLVKTGIGQGVQRRRVHLGDAGRGVQRRRVHLGDAGRGVHRKLVCPDNGDNDSLLPRSSGLLEWMRHLCQRLRYVRVCCGDWSRVLGPTPTVKNGLTGILLDPPYSDDSERDMDIYAEDDGSVANDVRDWAIANGDNPLLRIALCGYDNLTMPGSWEMVRWSTRGGYGNLGQGRGKKNRNREVIWFSPHCLQPNVPRQQELEFADW